MLLAGMTEHRSINTVMGYFQAGSVLTSRTSNLFVELTTRPKDEE